MQSPYPIREDAEVLTRSRGRQERRRDVHSIEHCVAVRVAEIATCGCTRINLRELDKVCEAADVAISDCSLVPGQQMWQQRFFAHVTGKRGEHVVEIFALKMKMKHLSASCEYRWRSKRSDNHGNELDHVAPATGRGDNVGVSTFVAP